MAATSRPESWFDNHEWDVFEHGPVRVRAKVRPAESDERGNASDGRFTEEEVAAFAIGRWGWVVLQADVCVDGQTIATSDPQVLAYGEELEDSADPWTLVPIVEPAPDADLEGGSPLAHAMEEALFRARVWFDSIDPGLVQDAMEEARAVALVKAADPTPNTGNVAADDRFLDALRDVPTRPLPADADPLTRELLEAREAQCPE